MESNFKANVLDHRVNKLNLINTDRALMLSEDLKVIIQRYLWETRTCKVPKGVPREIISCTVKPNRNTLY